MKKPIPVWAVVASVAAVLGVAIGFYAKAANGGDASKEELSKIRNNMRNFASAPAPTQNADGRGGMPLGGPGAPPGAIVDPRGR